VALHGPLDESEGRGLVAGLGDEGFQRLAPMVDGPQQLVPATPRPANEEARNASRNLTSGRPTE
jgi:hypothetical protein